VCGTLLAGVHVLTAKYCLKISRFRRLTKAHAWRQSGMLHVCVCVRVCVRVCCTNSSSKGCASGADEFVYEFCKLAVLEK